MYHLIIADDEPRIRTGLMYRNDWKGMGFQVDALLEDGNEVMDYLAEHREDVLLTDICMYQMSGLTVASEVRKKYPWMKIVLLSGYQKFEYAQEAIRYQVYEYILKPIDTKVVRSIFEKIKKELDASAREQMFLQELGEGEYEQILTLSHAVTGSIMGEGDDTWFALVKLKPFISQAPQELRCVFAKCLLQQLQSGLSSRAPALEEKYLDRMKSIDLSNSDEFHREICAILRDLNDELVSGSYIPVKNKNSDDSIERACQYIKNHLVEEFTYRDVAEFVHLSPRHFIRRFHEEMHMTFSEYLVQERIEGAQKLLDEGEVSSNEISMVVGYKDDKYFQQLFKKYVGCTPREYEQRQKYKGGL